MSVTENLRDYEVFKIELNSITQRRVNHILERLSKDRIV